MDGAAKMTFLLNYVDYIIVILIAISIIFSLIRGFVREVLALSTWIIAIWGAIHFGQYFAQTLNPYISTSSSRLMVAYATIFFTLLIVGMIVSAFLAGLIKKSALSGTDRVVGSAFGLLRGVLIISFAIMIAEMTALTKREEWHQSILIPYFEQSAHWILAAMPALGFDQLSKKTFSEEEG